MRRSAKNCGENAELRKGCGDLRYGDVQTDVQTDKQRDRQMDGQNETSIPPSTSLTEQITTSRTTLRVPRLCLWLVNAKHQKSMGRDGSIELEMEWIGPAVMKLVSMQSPKGHRQRLVYSPLYYFLDLFISKCWTYEMLVRYIPLSIRLSQLSFYPIYGAVCFQLTRISFNDCKHICTSPYHHQIGKMNH